MKIDKLKHGDITLLKKSDDKAIVNHTDLVGLSSDDHPHYALRSYVDELFNNLTPEQRVEIGGEITGEISQIISSEINANIQGIPVTDINPTDHQILRYDAELNKIIWEDIVVDELDDEHILALIATYDWGTTIPTHTHIHQELQGSGAYPHRGDGVTIDGHIDDTSTHFTEASIDIDNIISGHTHGAEDLPSTAHTHEYSAILNTGHTHDDMYYTETEIDAHTDASTIHFTEASINIDNIISGHTHPTSQLEAGDWDNVGYGVTADTLTLHTGLDVYGNIDASGYLRSNDLHTNGLHRTTGVTYMYDRLQLQKDDSVQACIIDVNDYGALAILGFDGSSVAYGMLLCDDQVSVRIGEFGTGTSYSDTSNHFCGRTSTNALDVNGDIGATGSLSIDGNVVTQGLYIGDVVHAYGSIFVDEGIYVYSGYNIRDQISTTSQVGIHDGLMTYGLETGNQDAVGRFWISDPDYMEYSLTGHNGNPCFTLTANTSSVSNYTQDFIPVDTSEPYKLKVSLRSDQTGTTCYFGVQCYDADKVVIGSLNTYVRPNTLSTVCSAITVGDEYVIFSGSDPGNWYFSIADSTVKTYARKIAIYDYTNSNGYTYPPDTYYGNRHTDQDTYPGCPHYNTGGTWATGATATSGASGWDTEAVTGFIKLKLSAPWPAGTAIPVGTSIANGFAGASWNYFIRDNSLISTAWTEYEGVISGEAGYNVHMFRPGTKYVRIGILNNQSDIYRSIDVSDISFIQQTKEFHTNVIFNESIGDITAEDITADTISTSYVTSTGITDGLYSAAAFFSTTTDANPSPVIFGRHSTPRVSELPYSVGARHEEMQLWVNDGTTFFDYYNDEHQSYIKFRMFNTDGESTRNTYSSATLPLTLYSYAFSSDTASEIGVQRSRVGINTDAPTYPLHVIGCDNESAEYTLGVEGSAYIDASLHVDDNIVGTNLYLFSDLTASTIETTGTINANNAVISGGSFITGPAGTVQCHALTSVTAQINGQMTFDSTAASSFLKVNKITGVDANGNEDNHALTGYFHTIHSHNAIEGVDLNVGQFTVTGHSEFGTISDNTTYAQFNSHLELHDNLILYGDDSDLMFYNGGSGLAGKLSMDVSDNIKLINYSGSEIELSASTIILDGYVSGNSDAYFNGTITSNHVSAATIISDTLTALTNMSIGGDVSITGDSTIYSNLWVNTEITGQTLEIAGNSVLNGLDSSSNISTPSLTVTTASGLKLNGSNHHYIEFYDTDVTGRVGYIGIPGSSSQAMQIGNEYSGAEFNVILTGNSVLSITTGSTSISNKLYVTDDSILQAFSATTIEAFGNIAAKSDLYVTSTITGTSIHASSAVTSEFVHSTSATTETLIFDDNNDVEKFKIEFNNTTNTLDFRIL